MGCASLHHVGKTIGAAEPLLDDVSVSVADGQCVALLGEAGSGKTMLLRLLCGLERATAGEVLVGGKRVDGPASVRNQIGMVFADLALYPHMNVFGNLAFALAAYGIDKAAMFSRIQQVSAILGIDALLDLAPHQLSGTAQFRVALARAAVRQPRLLLLDDPLRSLPVAEQGLALADIERLRRETGVAVVHAARDQSLALTMAQHVVVMRDGRTEQTGAPVELYTRPCSLYVAEMVGSPRMNLLPGRVVTSGGNRLRVRVQSGQQIVADVDATGFESGDPVTVGFRADDAVVAPDGHGQFDGRVANVEFAGSSDLIRVDLAQGVQAVIRQARHSGSMGFVAGQTVCFSVRAQAVQVFDRERRAAPRCPGDHPMRSIRTVQLAR